MPRVVLIHWNAAERAQRSRELRRAGYEVVSPELGGGAGLSALTENPPQAFVIDLSHLPSQGRDLGVFLRQRKATRRVPLVFAGGEPAKVARAQRLLPDAVYTGWEELAQALGPVLESPAADPVVPGTMSAYSGTPLPRKLGIKAGMVVVLLGAPEGFRVALGNLPDGVQVRRQARGPAEVILLFAPSRAHLRRRFPAAARALVEGGRLWIAWPKQASGVATDLTQAKVRAFGLEAGFVDFKIAALDDTWSGLAFARRRGGG